MRWLRGALWSLAIACAIPAIGAFARLEAAPVRVYRNEALRVRAFSPPSGWELAPQSPYPRLLASYTHESGARITLSAERVRAGITAQKLVDDARAGLERQGFARIELHGDGPRVRLDAVLEGGKRIARQIYLVDADVAYVLTLVAPAADRTRALGDFEEAVRSLELGDAPGR